MKNVIELRILGQKLVVRSDEDEEYIRKVEQCLNAKIEEVRMNTKAVATLDLALLVALNLSGELTKARDHLEAIEQRSEEIGQKIDVLLA